jgi:hypothetical protein
MTENIKTSNVFTVEPHGNGWAIFRGRDSQHHGLNLGRITECEPGVPEMIEAARNCSTIL